MSEERKFKVVALHLTGKGKKLYKSGDIVSERDLPVKPEDLMKEPHNVFIEPFKEGKKKKAAPKKTAPKKAKETTSTEETTTANEESKETASAEETTTANEESKETASAEETTTANEESKETASAEETTTAPKPLPEDFELKSEDDYNKVDITDLLDRCEGVKYDKKALKSDLYKVLSEYLENR
jgi:ABC-type proline/glycine betaine transport system ATPase subunit